MVEIEETWNNIEQVTIDNLIDSILWRIYECIQKYEDRIPYLFYENFVLKLFLFFLSFINCFYLSFRLYFLSFIIPPCK